MINEGSSSQRESKIKESNPVSQPAGWAGFWCSHYVELNIWGIVCPHIDKFNTCGWEIWEERREIE